jgi:putative transposase
MKYNPQIHNRRSIRLKGYDYSQAGAYFITICCAERKYRFGNVVNGEMILNEYGVIAYNEWVKLSERFFNFELDVFQIMPNHMHGIIVLNGGAGNNVGAGLTPAHNTIDGVVNGSGVNPAPTNTNATIFDMVGAYKSLVSNECLKIYKSKNELMGKLWQRNYYENIIRNEQAYHTISNYIINNPANWGDDKFNVK